MPCTTGNHITKTVLRLHYVVVSLDVFYNDLLVDKLVEHNQ